MIPFSSLEYQAWTGQENCSESRFLVTVGMLSEIGMIDRTAKPLVST